MDTTNDDAELLAQWLGGHTGAGNKLVRRYHAVLLGFFRYKVGEGESEDFEQQVWLELTKSRPSGLKSTFRAYLFGIARHVLFRYCERKRRVPGWDPLTSSLAELDHSLSQKLIQAVGERDLRAVLQQMPLDVQLLIEARYVHDLSVAELAAMYEVPSGTIKSRLSSARKRIQAAMPLSEQWLPQH